MSKLIDFFTAAGFEIPVIAFVNVILTGILKLPIKRLADKTKNPKKITRFITLFPVIIGFGLTVLFMFAKNGEVSFNDGFYNVWLSSVSLSLAMYAFWEKFVPSEKKILSEAEINANKAAVEELKDKLVPTQPTKDNQSTETDENVSASHKKIIISNSKNLK